MAILYKLLNNVKKCFCRILAVLLQGFMMGLYAQLWPLFTLLPGPFHGIAERMYRSGFCNKTLHAFLYPFCMAAYVRYNGRPAADHRFYYSQGHAFHM